ncbi:MAG: BMP family ABC transporter substrate-binding protein [Erysipelotrichaceae bacterium]|nr:BMP family ABC transporter substrate-binding protein [Erysipelotrichaceae bacterium]
MKKFLIVLIGIMMALSLVGCGSNSSDDSKETAESTSQTTDSNEEKVTVALLLPYIGDQSYFDVTYNSFKLIEEKYGDQIETKLIEMGSDEAGWASANLQAAQEGYDIIISGNFQYESYMLEAAEQFPDITYINFDYSDAELNDLPNVYGLTYKSEQIGYLAGIVAAVKTESNTVGAIGGMEINSIKQFLGGFIQGALAVNPDIDIKVGFVGDFTDTGKMKEIALNMNKQGADVIWHAAGGAGNGLFEAAAEAGFYAIGVDTDQYASLSSKPELAKTIITSATKNCDIAILSAIDLYMEGKLPLGTLVSLGYKENGVGLAENDYYNEVLSEEEKTEINKFTEDLKNGNVTVIDVSVDSAQWDTLIDKISK